MIRLLPVELPQHALDALHGFQRRVDAGATYADQVVLAKRLFPQQNKPKNKTFNAVKHALTELCSGARRCCYCEDSVADEAEHIKPKNLYPEVVFAWENYLYACGPCNGPKNNGFAVFATDDGRIVHVRRARGAPVRPPTPGAAVLIDPRWEDPLEYMELDLLDTFVMVPLDDADSPSISVLPTPSSYLGSTDVTICWKRAPRRITRIERILLSTFIAVITGLRRRRSIHLSVWSSA